MPKSLIVMQQSKTAAFYFAVIAHNTYHIQIHAL